MNILTYLMKSRGPVNAARRLSVIGRRFGLSSARMERALQDFSKIGQEYGCTPTLAVTAVLLERYPQVFQRLQEGVEMAVHGYVHTDYSRLDDAVQTEHMERALRAFGGLGLSPEGFRCPYLRWNEDSFHVASRFGLTYGSNRSLAWDVLAPEAVGSRALAAYQKGLRLYGAGEAVQGLSLPSRVDGTLLDIPASLPDDEAMVDRLQIAGSERAAAVWMRMLEQVYQRGELLTLILHHERVGILRDALEAVLVSARAHDPRVWMAPLREIARWWAERLTWRLQVQRGEDGVYQVVGPEAPGATVVVRGVETEPATVPWFGAWRMVPAPSFAVRSPRAPIIVPEEGCSPAVTAFLEEEGFAVGHGAGAEGLRIGGYSRFDEADKRALVDFVEGSDAPLVRIWRWPNGARCAMSVTGDVDAMTVLDFLRRPLEV
jgi:peptidoglycan/xylan/chitin deacetylase (PgdA/CDA1 family)